MRKINTKQFAVALVESVKGKKKKEIDTLVKNVIARFGIRGELVFLKKLSLALEEIITTHAGIQKVSIAIPSGDEKQIRRLTADSVKRAGSAVELSVFQDPSLVAGAVLTIGDMRYDGSVKARMKQLKKHMRI